MMTTEETQVIFDRLDRLESKDAIRGLVSAYAIACDEHDMSRLMALFTQDAIFDAPNGSMVASGYDAIRKMFINTFRIRGPSYHWTHYVTVEIDPSNPDHATGLVLSHAETSPDGVVSIAAMRYEDEHRREADRWHLAKRTIHFLYYVPAEDYSAGLNQKFRVVMADETLAADYPEKLAPWLSFIEQHGE
jgi:ketosteroid isomerase-like protein